MSQAVLCPQCDLKFSMAVADDLVTVQCPQCGRRIVVGDQEDYEEMVAAEEEEERQQVRQRKKRRKKQRERMAGLDRVNQGLLFHFIAMALFTLALLMFWIGFGIVLSILVSGVISVPALGMANAMLWIAMGATVLATLLEIPNGVLSMFVPNSQCRLFLILSLVFRGLSMALAVIFLVIEDKGPIALGLLLMLLISWVLWLLFLWRLCQYIKQEAIAADVMRCLVHTAVNIVVAAAFLFVISIYVRLMVLIGSPLARIFLTATLATPFGLMLAAAFKLSYQTSILKVLLYPSGVTFMMRYLEVLGSVRMFLHRRA